MPGIRGYMTLENEITRIPKGVLLKGLNKKVENAEKKAGAPKEPELTGIRKHLNLIGFKKEIVYAWVTAAALVGAGFLYLSPIYKNAKKRVEEYPSHIIRMEGIAYKKELTNNWRSYFLPESGTEQMFFDSETKKRNKDNHDPNMRYYPCAREDCSPYEHSRTGEQK